jgi:hypothetical protein
MTMARGKVRYWTADRVIEEASKYDSRKEFYIGNASAYNAAKKLKMMDSLFGFIRKQWTEESLRDEASKYSTRVEFYRGNGSAYATALRQGMIDILFPDRCGGTDNNAVYIWRAKGQFFNGNPVYKIGVTSTRLGTLRIEQVAKAAGFEFSIVCCESVKCKANDLEKKLHLLGESPVYDGFNGYTEFRALSDSALYAAISIICEVI